MKFRTLPGTDLRLSVIGMGCWGISGDGWGDTDDDVSIAAIHQALESGINWFDTAPIYGDGHADRLLMKALRATELGRDAIVATKVGILPPVPGEHPEADLSAEHLFADTDRSLERLGVDTIDLLQVHWPCQQGTPLEQTLHALNALRTMGKVRYVGVCNYNARTLRRIRELAPWVVSLQTPYSLLEREFELDLRDAAEGIGVLAYAPLCRGLLSGKFTSLPSFPENDIRRHDPRFSGGRFGAAQRFVGDMRRIAVKIGLPTAAVAGGWVAAQPGVTAAIVGAKTPEQVRENVAGHRVLGRKNLNATLRKLVGIHGL